MNDQPKRYQLRLKPGETLNDVLALLTRDIAGFFGTFLITRKVSPAEENALKKELRQCLDHYVTGRDLCGLKASCFETTSPLEGAALADPVLSAPHDWDGVRILQLEVKEGFEEFLSAVEAAALRAFCKDPKIGAQARTMKLGLEPIIRNALAPRLFVSMEHECDLCTAVKSVDPWAMADQAPQ